MSENNQEKKEEKKGFWTKMIDKLNKKLKENAQNSCCCGPKDKSKGPTCCS